MLVTDDPIRVADWVWPRTHGPEGFQDFQAVGVENQDGVLVAGMVFTGCTPNFNVEIHLAIDDPRAVGLSFYKYTFQYAFLVLNVKRVTAICREGYKRNERLLKGMCFKKEGVARSGYLLKDGSLVDAGLYSCLRSECRLIPKEYRTMKDLN